MTSPWPAPSGPPPDFSPASRIGIGYLALSWVTCYALAVVVSGVLLAATGTAESGTDQPTWVVALSALGLWLPFLAMLQYTSRARLTGNLRTDYFIHFSWRDAWGVPIGVASQLVLVNLVMWPLRVAFPDVFDPADVERRARDLVDAASGAWIVLLAIVVVVGAPFVEELVYRAYIQARLEPITSRTWSVIIAAVWFTIVHLEPVEFPGLFAFALVLGLCFARTKRIGLSIVAHVAFNVTGLVLVLAT